MSSALVVMRRVMMLQDYQYEMDQMVHFTTPAGLLLLAVCCWRTVDPALVCSVFLPCKLFGGAVLLLLLPSCCRCRRRCHRHNKKCTSSGT
jgi:hypothetical protein